jgi:hypothetical protein
MSVASTPTPTPAPTPTFFSGLDLGQLADFSALCVAECSEQSEGGKHVRRYAVRHLQRWPLRTSYTDIVEDVVRMFAMPPLTSSSLIVDATGVGVGVMDFLRKARPAARLIPVTISGGAHAARRESGCWSVPKRELAGVLGILLGTRRLQVSPALPLAQVLAREMSTFKVKVNISTGGESFEAWRERDHDDLVLATALACWYSERAQRQLWLHVGGEAVSTAETGAALGTVHNIRADPNSKGIDVWPGAPGWRRAW